MSIAYLNGIFLPIEEATIPVLDRGFLFGDGVYEVIPVYGREPFRLDDHLHRLENSLKETRILNPHSSSEWCQLITDLIKKNSGNEQSIYLQVTRGSAPRDHVFPDNTPPTLFMMSNPLMGSSTEVIEHGISAITEVDSRWSRCNIKSINLLANVLHRQHAMDQGAKESILLRDGQVTEGAASNLFIAKNNRVITPPKGPYLLPGVTRDLVLELAQQDGINITESAVDENMLEDADEIWLTSSTKEIVPVTVLNGAPVGKGKPGLITLQLNHLLQQFKREFRNRKS